MHKNPLQNTGKGIKGTLFFETFRGSMPRNPLEVSAPSVQVGQIHVCPPKISRPVRLYDSMCTLLSLKILNSTCVHMSRELIFHQHPFLCLVSCIISIFQNILDIFCNSDEDPSLRIESSAIINLRGVSTKLNKNNYSRVR